MKPTRIRKTLYQSATIISSATTVSILGFWLYSHSYSIVVHTYMYDSLGRETSEYSFVEGSNLFYIELMKLNTPYLFDTKPKTFLSIIRAWVTKVTRP